MRGCTLAVKILLLIAQIGCTKTESAKLAMFRVPEIGLEIPKLSGWMVDPAVQAEDPAKGGVIFRLARESPVPMSPRIDVYVEPLGTQPTVLEEFLTQNLRDMAQLESGDKIRITQVEKRPIALGPRRAYHVLHEYSMLNPGQAPVAITQLSTILVLDGRGVAVTAAGRTELFHPLSDPIERMLTGLALPIPKASAATPLPGQNSAPTSPILKPDAAQPIDLGKVGGKK